MSEIMKKLKGGDLRSIGRSEEVVQDILENPTFFGEVFEGMSHEDPRVRMRSADALEKVSRKHPEYLQPFKSRLIGQISKIEQQEVRWHTAQMFSYLDMDEAERDEVIEILFSYIDTDKSRIVKVSSMQTLADLAEKNEAIKPEILERLKEITSRGSPAMVSRGRKLIKKLTGK
jgi:hypothetical protein